MVWYEGISKVNVSRLSLSCSTSMTLCCSVFTVLLQLLNNVNRWHMLDPPVKRPSIDAWMENVLYLHVDDNMRFMCKRHYLARPQRQHPKPVQGQEWHNCTEQHRIRSVYETHSLQHWADTVSIQSSSYNPRVSVNGVKRGRKELTCRAAWCTQKRKLDKATGESELGAHVCKQQDQRAVERGI